MMYRTFIFSVLTLAGFVAANPARSPEIDAATYAAREDLRAQLLNIYIAPGVVVRDVVQLDHAAVDIDGAIAKAEAAGLPRWVGEDVVQVKLMLPGRAVIAALKPTSKGLAGRLTSADIERFNRDWSRRSLQATGQAIPASRVQKVVATLQRTSWSGVSSQDKSAVAAQARGNATLALLDQVNAIHVSPAQTVANTMAPGSQQTLAAWSDGLPAMHVDLRDDRQIEIGVFVDKTGLNDVMRGSMNALPEAEQAHAIAIGIGGLPDTIVGRAMLASATAMPQPPIALRELPAWANDPINAEAEAKFLTTQLRTARAAERSAREALRDKVLALPIEGKTTLGQRAQNTPALNSAIDAAIDRARVYQADYHADGSATVRVSLDPNELLDRITASR